MYAVVIARVLALDWQIEKINAQIGRAWSFALVEWWSAIDRNVWKTYLLNAPFSTGIRYQG